MLETALGTLVFGYLNTLLYIWAGVFSLIANGIGKILLWVAGFSEFTTLPQITEAWMVVRDFSNMFFIVILLIIAFGTILNIESYSYKKLLGKLLLMAVLINFSKTICGLIIDGSQVFMFTFLNAMDAVREAGFLKAFGIHDLMSPVDQIADKGDVKMNNLNTVYTLGVVVAILVGSSIIMLVYTVVLLLRITMLWILIVLSPLAYVLNILPQTEKYAKKWWDYFGRYVIVGPLVAFFLWLTLFIATAGIQDDGSNITTDGVAGSLSGGEQVEGEEPVISAAMTEGASAGQIVNFIIAGLLMVGGLGMVSEFSKEFGKITGKVQSLGTGAVKMLGTGAMELENKGRKLLAGGAEKAAGKVSDWGKKSYQFGLSKEGEKGGGFRAAINKFGGRGLDYAGRLGEGVNKVVGTELDYTPKGLATAGKAVMSKWREQRSKELQSNTQEGMSNVLAGTRWGGRMLQNLASGKIIRDNQNQETTDEALKGVNLKGMKKQQGIINSTDEDVSDADKKAAKKELEGLRDTALASLERAEKTFEQRMGDASYHTGERNMMGDSVKILKGLHNEVESISGDGSNGTAFTNIEAEKKRKELKGFGEASASRQETYDTWERWGDKAAGTYSRDTKFNVHSEQANIAEATKKLETEANSSGSQVRELGKALDRGDQAMIVATMRAIWNGNSQNELHENASVLNFMREAVKKKAKADGRDDAGVDEVMKDFEKNYTKKSYLQMFTQEALTKAYNGDVNAAVKEDMNLGHISSEKNGGSTHGSSHMDSSTGRGVFNEAGFEKYEKTDVDGNVIRDANGKVVTGTRVVASQAQNKAAQAKRKNMKTSTLMSTLHPQVMVNFTTDGSIGGLNEGAVDLMSNSTSDMFMNTKIMRGDYKEAHLNARYLEDTLAEIKKSKGREKTKTTAYMLTMAGVARGDFSDKDAAKFYQDFMKESQSFNDNELEDVVEKIKNGTIKNLNSILTKKSTPTPPPPSPSSPPTP